MFCVRMANQTLGDKGHNSGSRLTDSFKCFPLHKFFICNLHEKFSLKHAAIGDFLLRPFQILQRKVTLSLANDKTC